MSQVASKETELSFEDTLERFADLVVRVGLNLQPGQQLMVRAAVETAPFTRKVVETAYRAGAPFVNVLWNDDAVTLARFEHAPRDSFELFPEWTRDALLAAAARGDAILTIYAADPELLKDQNSENVATVQRVTQTEMRPFTEHIMNSDVNWCIVSVPIPSWAAKVFPHTTPEVAERKLWDAIFKTVRADRADSGAAWQTHLANLEARRTYLTDKQYRALHYRAPGTDLTVGLADGHLWLGGTQPTQDGTVYVANLPTEEVFTMPHRERVDGTVRNSLPLSYVGNLIDGFELTFKDGAVVDYKAERGAEVLEHLLETDEGARHLGEVALVPHSSPISQSGILYYNTLFDENASSHLALGRAYRFNVAGGTEMSEAEVTAAGANDSLTHVDFMIGTADMDVDGVTDAGEREPVMRGGEWAFEV
ncbi:aminopeptidase [soil metagenome]